MPLELLLKAIRKRLKRIARLARRTVPDYELETIHRFRTEVKKLRAYLRLAGTFADDRFSRLPKWLRKIYRAAGEIRDGQLQLQALITGKEQQVPGFAIWLAGGIAAGQQQWQRLYRKKYSRRLRIHLATLSWPPLETGTLSAFFGQRIDVICTAAAGADPGDEVLHEVRKSVKDMQYVAAWCRKRWPEGYESISHFPVQELEPLSDAAGKYNDGVVGLALLHAYLTRHDAGEGILPEQELMVRRQQQHEADKTRLLAAIRHFCSKARPSKGQPDIGSSILPSGDNT